MVEVNRPDKAERRRIGKSDPIDAYAAARAVVSGRAGSAPKGDAINGIRSLHNAARSAIKARTATLNQIGHILISAPDDIRVKYEVLQGNKRIEALTRLRLGDDPVRVPILTALRTLARRVKNLTEEHDTLTAAVDALVTHLNPGLRAAYGVGPDTATQLLITAGDNPNRLRTEASFAALCGAAPVPASSGKTNRHRLSRGGDRAANGALYLIALVRMARDRHTRDYVERQTKAGRTKKEIIRLLNAPSRGRSSATSPRRSRFPRSLTSGRPAKPRTSRSPPPRTTSGSGLPSSPTSSEAIAATMPSPPPTATGSPPLDQR
ncbi:transposase [Streptomyces sp. V1I1]|uniref:transposase n=1 Tax=Streptomyces sp. V1I1 TaxID=3042272 RepID=UPI0027893E73|nr:transposase [Streptomyces sp. V1I1]MDQ0945899.1 transposase [Streptomyces sp. V1I1]